MIVLADICRECNPTKTLYREAERLLTSNHDPCSPAYQEYLDHLIGRVNTRIDENLANAAQLQQLARRLHAQRWYGGKSDPGSRTFEAVENGIFGFGNAPDWLQISLEDIQDEEATYDRSEADYDDIAGDL